MLKFRKIIAITTVIIAGVSLMAKTVNVMDFGAKGDGRTDDTEAVQKAINAASQRNSGGVLLIPAGRYAIKETLKLHQVFGLTIRGEGAMGYKAGYTNATTTQSVLEWHGEENGTLFHSHNCFGNNYENLAFYGRPGKAGILFLTTTSKGGGNMVHRFSNLSFSNAKIGMQMGSSGTQKTNDSDLHLESIFFGSLETGFYATHEQSVDHTFAFVFGLNVKTVFNFQRGGNLLVNTAQLTNCNVLHIGQTGFNNGLFLLNNVRLESSSKHLKEPHRWQLLTSGDNVGFAMVRFNNFCDAQWFWFKQDPQPQTPLCDINAGMSVVFDNSAIQGPLAVLKGNDKSAARLVVQNSGFRYIRPTVSVKSNEHGYFKLVDNFNSSLTPFPDTVNWKKSTLEP